MIFFPLLSLILTSHPSLRRTPEADAGFLGAGKYRCRRYLLLSLIFTAFNKLIRTMELSEILYNKAEYIETVMFWFLSCCLLLVAEDEKGVFHWNPFRRTTNPLKILKNVSKWSQMLSSLLQASGNKVSRQSVLCGSQNIVLNGKVGGKTTTLVQC